MDKLFNFKYYNFKDGVIRLGACVERAYEFFDLPRKTDGKTIGDLLENLRLNGRRYRLYDYESFIDGKFRDDFTWFKGFLIWNNEYSGHVGMFEAFTYYDAFNHFKYGKPNYIILLDYLG